ncbi:sugar transferase [Candidatus Cetobacterium colombiensis]|uniref:Sugar transferase n=1 Tax=Candidatus Cetobacterium colombiensis TaxID=3073100 RepID=A0ABU4WF82_9FUSO|nr:sugar transferase [Candidatus Cetobacterium colombiensis]MDX8337148.1 sugar transferase [Candidatus Cetobacterium colombiensis]
MKHSQNSKGRIIYTMTLLLLFEIVRENFRLDRELIFYSLFPIMIFSYYIFDTFSFNKKYRYREFIISGVINGFVFYVLAIFYEKPTMIFGWAFYTLMQNIVKYFYNSTFSPMERVVLLTDKKEEVLERVIERNEKLCFEGCVNLGEINRIKEINPSEVIYPIEMTDRVVDDIFDLKMSGVKVKDSMAFLQEVEGKIDVDSLSKDWVIKAKGFEVLSSGVEQRIKRFLDIAMSVVIVLVGAPFMVFTYFLVKLDNPKNFLNNPAFFKQKRIGSGGKEFEIVKFRSMRLHDPKEHSKYASKKDDRITRVGKFIRKTRLDELPQILNVLKGDMSFVGPRPEWNELGREYEKEINMYKVRYAVKPGLTGWAQVMYPYGASLDDAKKKLEYDIYYIKHQNVILDIMILFKTVKVVLFGKGM